MQDLSGIVVAPLRLIYPRQVVGNINRIRHHGLSFFQIFQGQIKFPATAIDLRDANVGLRIFRIGVGNNFVLFESGLGLAIVHQVFRQAANGIEVVTVEGDGLSVRVNGFFVFLLLLVGVSEYGIKLCRTRSIRNGTQNLRSPSRVSFLGVKQSQCGDRFFGIRLQLEGGLELALRLLQIIVDLIKAAEEQMIVHAVRLNLDDLLVLLDSQLQHILGAIAGLDIAKRA